MNAGIVEDGQSRSHTQEHDWHKEMAIFNSEYHDTSEFSEPDSPGLQASGHSLQRPHWGSMPGSPTTDVSLAPSVCDGEDDQVISPTNLSRAVNFKPATQEGGADNIMKAVTGQMQRPVHQEVDRQGEHTQ